MPNTREKLIELLYEAEEKCEHTDCGQCEHLGLDACGFRVIANHLIANGVTLQNHDCHWATEQAYKNGYEQGVCDFQLSITRCWKCTHSDTIDCSDGMVWCARMCRYMKEDGFCSFGERKTK